MASHSYTHVPASALIRGAQDIARQLLALRCTVGIGEESATVVIDDVVFVPSGRPNTSQGDSHDVVVVWVIVPDL